MANENELKQGDRFEGPSRTLTDAHFLFFSALTGDVHPLHSDVEFAKRTRFKRPLAHGLLLTSLTALGASTARTCIDGFVFVEQGSTLLKPAVVGDTLRPLLEVERVWQEGAKQFCRIKTLIVNQRDETVLEGFHVYRIMPLESKVAP